MKIQILPFGKLKTPGLRTTADHYMSRISSWSKIEESELKGEIKSGGSLTPGDRKQFQLKEGKLFLDRISTFKKGPSSKIKTIILDETGKNLDTIHWAKLIQDCENSGISDMVFGLGSSIGWGSEVLNQADSIISLGHQTMAHELARVALLEQIYRALSVNHGHPYHVGD